VFNFFTRRKRQAKSRSRHTMLALFWGREMRRTGASPDVERRWTVGLSQNVK